MASSFSFDVVSDYDISEVDHAVDQARREIAQRYDFKGTAAALDYRDSQRSGLALTGDSQYQLDALVELVRSKLAKRGVSQKVLSTAATQPEQQGMKLHWDLPFQRGLDQEKAKQLTKLVRDHHPKVKTQIQGEAVRVTSTSKDDLQAVIQLLQAQEFEWPLQFENYR